MFPDRQVSVDRFSQSLIPHRSDWINWIRFSRIWRFRVWALSSSCPFLLLSFCSFLFFLVASLFLCVVFLCFFVSLSLSSCCSCCVMWSLIFSDKFCHGVVYGHWVTRFIWKNQGTFFFVSLSCCCCCCVVGLLGIILSRPGTGTGRDKIIPK